jgi:ubiquinone/menaquinone biosynthesis C-methylase UbiE
MLFEVTPTGDKASEAFHLYEKVARFIYSGIPMESYLFDDRQPSGPAFQEYAKLVDKCIQNWGLPIGNTCPHRELFEVIGTHLDGMLVGPLMIAAKMRGLLENDYLCLNDLPGSKKNMVAAFTLLQHLGWIYRNGKTLTFTDLGKLACNFSLHYGLTLSYFPMFCNLSKLIFNSTKNITHVQPGNEEHHVDRTLNVLASGVAHRPYFEDSDKIIIDIFDREPLDEQPRFVADMGCGDGAWLKRIYKVVKSKTLRGRNLDRFPLLMVGADYNVKALDVARVSLDQAGVPNIVLFGDVGDPDQFTAALRDHDVDIRDGLHIRAFIDHNRPYTKPVDMDQADRRQGLSTGTYADENGALIPNSHLEQNLVEHFKKWVPYIGKHGLIIIEAHNVEPQVASRYKGRTHATAFDTYHGYSNQYPIDFAAFMQLAEEAGFRSIVYQQKLYPSRLPFVAISLNRFKTSVSPTILEGFDELEYYGQDKAGDFRDKIVRKDDFEQLQAGPQGRASQCPLDPGAKVIPHKHGWKPDGSEDLDDGEALHHLLYQDGDTGRPKSWCSYSTGILVQAVLEEIETRLSQTKGQEPASRSMTLVDYGAGTGLATLELIKSLEQKGLLKQCDRYGVEVSLLLFDFPSGWFAKAYELLNRFAFVDFYSLKDSDTHNIRLISDVLNNQTVDIIYASMVLHLVPPKAMPALFHSFAKVLKEGGGFIWNTPDTAPPLSNSEVIHATNRALRKTFIAVLDDEDRLPGILSRVPEDQRSYYSGLLERIVELRRRLSPKLRADAKARAEKQILSVPTNVELIKTALAKHFVGRISNAMSVLPWEDSLALALLPSNQRYINEVDDPDCRKRLIALLLKYDVLPRFRAGPTSNSAGLNLHWTFGRYARTSS